MDVIGSSETPTQTVRRAEDEYVMAEPAAMQVYKIRFKPHPHGTDTISIEESV